MQDHTQRPIDVVQQSFGCWQSFTLSRALAEIFGYALKQGVDERPDVTW